MSVNASPSWPYPGARWWKFDFHTHTPASKDTGAWQAAIRTPNELTPQTWLLKYMAAEIDCVAVTDHNTGEWIDRLKAAYAEMKREADDIANLAFIGGKTNRAISDKAPVTHMSPQCCHHVQHNVATLFTTLTPLCAHSVATMPDTFRPGPSLTVACPQHDEHILCAGSREHKECGRWARFRQKSGAAAWGQRMVDASSLHLMKPRCGHAPGCRPVRLAGERMPHRACLLGGGRLN